MEEDDKGCPIIRLGMSGCFFWYRPTWVVPDESRMCVCVLFDTTRVSRYQKGKTNLDFTEARDSEWQWHQLGHTQVCTTLQTDNHASTPPLSFLQARCPSCRQTNGSKALKATYLLIYL